MAILPRRPTLIGILCIYVLISLIVVLIVFTGSDGNSGPGNAEGDMDVATTCTVIPGTMEQQVKDGQCLYHVDVSFQPAGLVKYALAYSGIKPNVFGDCLAAAVFRDTFSASEATEQPCWYDPVNTDNVRLWSAAAADGAVPPADDDSTAAITVVIVLLAIVLVVVLLYAALKCGVFGDRFAFRQAGFRPLPTEPSAAQSPPALETPMLGVGQGGAYNNPYQSTPMSHVQPPAAEPMVMVGCAQVPASLMQGTSMSPLNPHPHPPPPHQQYSPPQHYDPLDI